MINLKSLLMESLEKRNARYWIHYSNVDYLKLKTDNLSHFDLAGIYLFPYKFELKNIHSRGHFKNKKYKLVVKIQNKLNVLNWGTMNPEKLKELLTRMGHTDAYEEFLIVAQTNAHRQELESIPDFDERNKMLHKFYKNSHHDNWSSGWSLTNRPYTFMWKIFRFIYKNPLEWNSGFKKAGYDAIFDDTGAMWEDETQLIVLDDENIEVVKILQNDL